MTFRVTPSFPMMPLACGFALATAAIAAATSVDVARADFVDELPDLPLTPAPLPSASPQAPSRGEGASPGGGASAGPQSPPTGGEVNPTPQGGIHATPGKGSATPAKKATPEGATPTTAPSGGGGLLGADVVAHDSNAPISTQGDVLEGSLNKGKLILTGNVEIRQDDTLMKSDTAEVFSKAGTTTPERAVAKGRVSILKRPNPRVPEIRAVADELEYFVEDRRVILKGKPKIWRGKELLQGEVIELALDTGDIRIRSARSILDPRTQQEFSNSGGGNPK